MKQEVKEAQCAHPPPLDNDDVIGSNQCLCLPKAELNTKNSTKRQLCCRLVEFLVFNSIGQLISLPSDEVYRVGDGGPDHAVVLHILCVSPSPPLSLR